MRIVISKTADDLGRRAADKAAELIKAAIADHGCARIVLSTGASQFETLKYLVEKDIDWKKVEMFHLDEYVDLPITHPASFRKYLKERFVDLTGVPAAHYVDGTPEGIAALTQAIREAPIDVGLIGIGRNSHIAFNDPPADFDTRVAYLIVNLDAACRNQQVAEGWFAAMEDVPRQAVSMSVWQIMQCKCIVSAVPHEEKAWAVAHTLANELTPKYPATMLKTHDDFNLFVDAASYADAKEIVTLKGKTEIVDER
ncbi:MAG: 6-phosphogluconolactonase [Clostridiales bacterium]|nr:6-phosphogluconolactonase [Clostridiales bacterium]